MLLPSVVARPSAHADGPVAPNPPPAPPPPIPSPGLLQLDPHLPVETLAANSQSTNINATFGSRFNFNIQPGEKHVYSGTEGIFHDNPASYVVGVTPQGQSGTQMFHMGTLNTQLTDSYLANERWQQGLDTSRWEGQTSTDAGLNVTLDIINAFQGEPGCVVLQDCADSVQADTLPILYIGVQLQNISAQPQRGNFIFGSNRQLPTTDACPSFTTAGGQPTNSLFYASSSDSSQGLLFLAGD